MKHFGMPRLIGMILCVTLIACGAQVQNARKGISLKPRKQTVEAVEPKEEEKRAEAPKVEAPKEEPRQERRREAVKPEKEPEPTRRSLAEEIMRAAREVNRKRLENAGNASAEEGNAGGSISLSDHSDAISEKGVKVKTPIANAFGTAAISQGDQGLKGQTIPIPVPTPGMGAVQAVRTDTTSTEAAEAPPQEKPAESESTSEPEEKKEEEG